jgi:hypothetical protein
MRAQRDQHAPAISRATTLLVCSMAALAAASTGAARAQAPAVVKADTGELQGVVGEVGRRPARRGIRAELHAGAIRAACPGRCARAAATV